MIGLAFYNSTNTTLDLNGPYLRFTSTPESVTVNAGESVILSGLATAEFKHNPSTIPGERVTNTGDIAYQWYINGTAAEDVPGKISGSQTNQLHISDLQNPSETGQSVFLRATYVESAYQSEEGDITAGIARSTGKASNEDQRLDSNATGAVVVTVNPTISITTQPTDDEVAQGVDATFTVVASASDDSDVSYQWNQDGTPLTNSSTVSGAQSPTLTISSDTIGDSTITVTVSHPTAGNSPVTSDDATLTVVDARQMIKVEQLNYGSTSLIAPTESYNLFERQQDNDPVRLGVLLGGRSYVVWADEKDVKVKITIAAPAGADRNGNKGGEGGISVFVITMEKNEEFVFKIAGNYGSDFGGGGAGAYIYNKAAIMAVAGAGGGAGTSGRGGDGGGMSLAGANGSGPGAGGGGATVEDGTATVEGYFQGGSQRPTGAGNRERTGGKISGCTIGGYYRRLGVPPCSDVEDGELTQARTAADGSIINGSGSIVRGYKAGLGYRNCGGIGDSNRGGGAAGYIGGDAASNNGGGGGASGYSNGRPEILSTQTGGNAGGGYFLIELANEIETVTFTQTRTTNENIQVIMTLVSGFGPSTITFGSAAGFSGDLPSTVTADIEDGSIYDITDTSNVDTRTLSDNTLTCSDTDSNPGSLSITPDKGRWINTTRYQF